MGYDWQTHFARVSQRDRPAHKAEDATFGAEKPSVASVRGIEKLSPADLRALQDSANRIGIPVDWLATVISFETGGSFSPTIRNAAGSGAVGLIQFMPTTAMRLLGTATEEEAVAIMLSMSFAQQLKYVEKYFAPYQGRLKSLDDVYLAILWPAAVGKAGSYVIATSPSITYRQNAGLDRNGDGVIVRDDVVRTIRSVLSGADDRVAIKGGWFLQTLFGGLLSFAFVYTGAQYIQISEGRKPFKLVPALTRIQKKLVPALTLKRGR